MGLRPGTTASGLAGFPRASEAPGARHFVDASRTACSERSQRFGPAREARNEAALERKRRLKRGPQLPLDPRLTDDSSVPDLLRDEPAPWFFPSLADADTIGGAPLLAGL